MTARRAAAPALAGLPNRPLVPVPAAPQAPRTNPLPTSPLLHIQRDDRESDRRRDGNRQKLTHSERTPLASTDYVPSLDQDAPRIIQKVMSYILENFKDTVSLSEAAEIAGMSESSFSRFFKKNSGNNFVDYVRKLRVSHACKILSETNMPVTEVCFEAGYNNISNFNRHFLAEKGVTPSQYRRMSARKFTAEASG